MRPINAWPARRSSVSMHLQEPANCDCACLRRDTRDEGPRTCMSFHGKKNQRDKHLLLYADLVKKLHEAGSKDDLKVPLRVLRDEIGRIYFGR